MGVDDMLRLVCFLGVTRWMAPNSSSSPPHPLSSCRYGIGGGEYLKGWIVGTALGATWRSYPARVGVGASFMYVIDLTLRTGMSGSPGLTMGILTVVVVGVRSRVDLCGAE